MRLTEFLSGIADAIRGAEGSSGRIPATAFAERIARLKASIKLQSKTVAPSATEKTVTADDGYDGLEQVTVSAMPTATQATPAITVSNAGQITASATQSAGYVAAGTKSASRQLATQPGKIVTPGTSQQTAVDGQVYTSGPVYVAGDSNLVAENICSGVKIFGVRGLLPNTAMVTGVTDVDGSRNILSFTIDRSLSSIEELCIVVVSTDGNDLYLDDYIGDGMDSPEQPQFCTWIKNSDMSYYFCSRPWREDYSEEAVDSPVSYSLSGQSVVVTLPDSAPFVFPVLHNPQFVYGYVIGT